MELVDLVSEVLEFPLKVLVLCLALVIVLVEDAGRLLNKFVLKVNGRKS